MYTTDQALQKASNILHKSTVSSGIMALAEDLENYRRIWSRDSMIAGIAGLLTGDAVLKDGLRNSVLSLASMQHHTGAIPSNVHTDLSKASYGSLAGRVDATTWWLVGAGLYIHNYGDDLKSLITDNVHKALTVMDCWEFNGRDLIYTPLSGNWADEYPLHGYLLYDNLLRYWALDLWAGILDDKELETKANRIKISIQKNFWPDATSTDVYHPKLVFHLDQSYYMAGFHPGNVYKVFDTAGNALALLLGLPSEDKINKITEYVQSVFTSLGHDMLPAFWPVIHEGDAAYEEIRSNYAYQFKNHAHHFHNGGIWPVMMGLFAMGLTLRSRPDMAKSMFEAAKIFLDDDQKPFAEYIDSAQFKPGGKKELCFSAAGCIFMAQTDKDHIGQKLNLKNL
jgi:glycogen debranching enzyme